MERRITPDDLALYAAETNSWDTTVWDTVHSLPSDLKRAIILRYYEELSLKNTAEILGISVNTLNTRLRRARKFLQDRLEGWYFDE